MSIATTANSITGFGFLSYIIKLMTQVPSTVSALKCSISAENKRKIVPETSYRTHQFYNKFDTIPPGIVLHAD